MPPKKSLRNQKNHIHIPANPERIKAEEIINRHKKRKEKEIPKEITNDTLYEMLIDILDRQEILEKKLAQTLHSKSSIIK